MIFDEIDFSQLPPSGEEAFLELRNKAQALYNQHHNEDYRQYDDYEHGYSGSYEPERAYVTCILAFLHEYNLEIDLPNIIELPINGFNEEFRKFQTKVDYIATRFALRKHRIDTGSAGTIISIAYEYKSEIGSLLETIRKIVNQEIKDPKKRDKIFSKIASLQSEIDRDQTTVDALFGRMLELSQVLGEAAENLDPLLDKLERIKKLFWDKSNKTEILPKKERPKLLTSEDSPDNIEDECPF